jgi:hypothetical protein
MGEEKSNFFDLKALLKPSKTEGVKGLHPLGSLPLWGSEGVTLQTADKRK